MICCFRPAVKDEQQDAQNLGPVQVRPRPPSTAASRNTLLANETREGSSPGPGLGSVNTEQTGSLQNVLSSASSSQQREQLQKLLKAVTARPEDVLLQQDMHVVPRPVSINLKQLDSEIKGLRRIGQGAGGIVYRGLWTGVPVAVKFMLSADPDQLNRTAKEAILSRFVSHPNVVQTYTYDVTLLTRTPMAPPPGRPSLLPWPHPSLSPRQQQGIPEGPGSGPGPPCSDAAASAQGLDGAGGGGAENKRKLDTLSVYELGMEWNGGLGHEAEEMDGGLAGCDMSEVLLRLGASPGQYLTHIIMELCDAGTLQQAVAAGTFSGSVSPGTELGTDGGLGSKGGEGSGMSRAKLRALIRTAREIARGLAHLHSLGIIHGDLKPCNVLLRAVMNDKRGFTAKVADFGLACKLRPDQPGVQTIDAVGTLLYISPEALRGSLLKSSDVYSFGVLLWQMSTGMQPYQGLHAAHVIVGKHQGTLQLAWPPDTYSPLRKLAQICMEQDPANRPSFDQVGKALQQMEHRLQQLRNVSASSATQAAAAASGPNTPTASASGPSAAAVAAAAAAAPGAAGRGALMSADLSGLPRVEMMPDPEPPPM